MSEEPAFTIVPMRAEDIDAVMAVERACFPTPWVPKQFLDELQQTQAHIQLLRRTSDGAVVGFINHWLVLDELHLLNVATLPQVRRRGLARRLIEHVLAFARDRNCRVVLLEVRRSNEPALALYRGLGFTSVGVRPGYYADNHEDALLMNLDL